MKVRMKCKSGNKCHSDIRGGMMPLLQPIDPAIVKAAADKTLRRMPPARNLYEQPAFIEGFKRGAAFATDHHVTSLSDDGK